MKSFFRYITVFLVVLTTASCEDVVDVDLNDENPRLVIDAAIKWQKGTAGETQSIRLSMTNNYYTSDIVPASGATVQITNSANTVFVFTEVGTTGEYVCTNFVPVINENYTLTVQYNGQTYSATNTLYATPEILYVEQETVTDVDGSDKIQLKWFFQDNGAEDNFYLLTVKNPNKVIPEYGTLSDEFFQGNPMFGFYSSSETESGSTILLQVQGISEQYYDYMNKLITISTTSGGNPFATPPVTLRSNIVNQTTFENYPLGYFSLGEIDLRNYPVQ